MIQNYIKTLYFAQKTRGKYFPFQKKVHSVRKKQNIYFFPNKVMMFHAYMQPEQTTSPLIIGYYPVRAKAQLCRLLCEYLHVDYVDKHLSPTDWDDIKNNQARDWVVKDLPFVIDGDFVVTGSTACSYYIIEKAGRCELFGRTIQDNIKITSFGNRKDLHSAVLGLICKVKANRSVEQTKQLRHYWATKLEPILQIQQKDARENDWYFGYISLMDFIIYIVMTQLQQTFPEEIRKFKKLNAIKKKVAQIPQIYEYQNSSRAVKCYNPVEYFNTFKEQMMGRSNGELKKASSRQMDLQ